MYFDSSIDFKPIREYLLEYKKLNKDSIDYKIAKTIISYIGLKNLKRGVDK
jgi:hypothetical protein